MSHITEYLLGPGICALPTLYGEEEIASMNSAVEPLLASRIEQKRAYIHPEEMLELGVMKMVMTEGMMKLLFSIMPDPVLYHCHVYEIAANDTRSHIFADSLKGWHRDPDSGYVQGDPTHVSIFIYLTNVGAEDGAFEFIPNVPPTKWLHHGADFISVQGKSGSSFAWHRSYYHRASPNRGPVRRRLIKLSIQRNKFTSQHLSNPHFRMLLAETPEGDVRMDLLLGRYQGRVAPKLDPLPEPETAAIPTNGVLGLSSLELTKAQFRDKALQLKNKLQGSKSDVVVAYD